MSTDPTVFEQVVIGRHARSPASPTPPADPRWRGILLSGPRVARAPVGHTPVVPLCVYSMLDVPASPLPTGWQVVVQSPTLPQPLRAPMTDVDESPEAPPPPESPRDPAELHGVAVGGYQNHDLLRLMRLPSGPGVYAVHVELGGASSNEITIEIAQDP